MISKAREVITSLISSNDETVFYGHILASCKLVEDPQMPAPAGVAFINNQFNLYINPSSFESYEPLGRKAILIHEADHIILNHIIRRRMKNPLWWNLAIDMAINQFIKNIPEDAVQYNGKSFGFSEKLSAEEYYILIRQSMNSKKVIKIQPVFADNTLGPELPLETDNVEKAIEDSCNIKDLNIKKLRITTKVYMGPNKGKIDTFDFDPHAAHEQTNNNSEFSEEHMRSFVDVTKSKLIQNALNSSRGNFPGEVAELIKINSTNKINWKKKINGFLSNEYTDYEETLKKRNKRFPNRYDIKGFRKIFSSKGIVIIDTSGSVTSKFISSTLGEIQKLSKNTLAEISLIQIDTKVTEVSNFDKNKSLINIKGRGGTELYPAIEYIYKTKKNYDWLIVITDGEIESNWAKEPKGKLMFLLPKDKQLNLKLNRKYEIIRIEN